MINILGTIGLILLAIALLLVMITIHEFGHYTAGKLLKFKIYEFSIGFGKAIFKKTKKNGEVFAVRLIPLGGYCSFGEDDAGTGGTAGKLGLDKNDPDNFNNKAPWKRLIVLFMGAFFNFVSAILFAVLLLFLVGYSRVGYINYVPDEIAVIMGNNVEAGSIITKAQIVDGEDYKKFSQFVAGDDIELTLLDMDGAEYIVMYNDATKETHDMLYDVITEKGIYVKEINGHKMNFLPTTGVEKILKDFRAGDNIRFTLTDGTEMTLTNVPFEHYNIIKNSGGYIPPNDGVYHNLGGALAKAVPAAFEMAWLILVLLGQMITGQLSFGTEIGGTVATVATMGRTLGQAASAGFIQIIMQMSFLVTLISINLAVFNLLPIPSLDGARMVFVVIEWVRGKPINRDLEAKIHFIGIMCLFAFVIFADIWWSVVQITTHFVLRL